jgi:hypothetical protein
MRPAQDERYALYGIHRDRNCVSAAGLNGKIRIGKDRSGDLRGVIGAARRRMDDQLARIGAHQAPLQLVESNNNRLRKALVGLHPRDVELLMMRHVEQIGEKLPPQLVDSLRRSERYHCKQARNLAAWCVHPFCGRSTKARLDCVGESATFVGIPRCMRVGASINRTKAWFPAILNARRSARVASARCGFAVGCSKNRSIRSCSGRYRRPWVSC